MKRESFLARRLDLWPTTERQEEDEEGEEEEEEEEGETPQHQMKNNTERSSTGRPHVTNTHTHRPGSHFLTHIEPTEGISLPPPSSSLPFDLSLSTLRCKSDLSKALGYLRTAAHTALYIVCHSDCVRIHAAPAAVLLPRSGRPHGGIF